MLATARQTGSLRLPAERRRSEARRAAARLASLLLLSSGWGRPSREWESPVDKHACMFWPVRLQLRERNERSSVGAGVERRGVGCWHRPELGRTHGTGE